jgi:hypothetical protein
MSEHGDNINITEDTEGHLVRFVDEENGVDVVEGAEDTEGGEGKRSFM